MGDYIDYPKLRLAHSHLLLKLTHPIHYLSFGKLGLGGPVYLLRWNDWPVAPALTKYGHRWFKEIFSKESAMLGFPPAL